MCRHGLAFMCYLREWNRILSWYSYAGWQALCPPPVQCHTLSNSSPSSHQPSRFLRSLVSLTLSSLHILLPSAEANNKPFLCTAVHITVPFPPCWAKLQTCQVLLSGRHISTSLLVFPCCQRSMLLNGKTTDLWEKPMGPLKPLHRRAVGSVTCTCLCSVFRVVEQSSCSVLQVGMQSIVRSCKQKVCLPWGTLLSVSIEQGLPRLVLNLTRDSVFLHGQNEVDMWGTS